MHLEILVEDQSGKKMLDVLIPKIIDNAHTFKVIPYKGVGRIPKNLHNNYADAANRLLLDQLPKLLNGYGKTFANYPADYPVAVILVCDLDDKCLVSFRKQLDVILDSCKTPPPTRFCIAIEEGEAWFLGDIPAVKKAYPRAKTAVLKSYVNDSICGTWERLADAVYSGGSEKLKSRGWQVAGAEKSNWAIRITPYLNIEHNKSPSFNYFYSKLIELTEDCG